MPSTLILRLALVAIAVVVFVLMRRLLKRRMFGAGAQHVDAYFRLKESNPAAAQAALDEYVRLNAVQREKQMQEKRGRAARDPKRAERYRQWLRAEMDALAEAETAPPDPDETPAERQENRAEFAKRRARLQDELDWLDRLLASRPVEE